jgi:hypothetical protein
MSRFETTLVHRGTGILLALLIAFAVVLARPSTAAASSCYWSGTQYAGKALWPYSGVYFNMSVEYKIGYTCGGSPVEIQLTRMNAYGYVDGTGYWRGNTRVFRSHIIVRGNGTNAYSRILNQTCAAAICSRSDYFSPPGVVIPYSTSFYQRTFWENWTQSGIGSYRVEFFPLLNQLHVYPDVCC